MFIVHQTGILFGVDCWVVINCEQVVLVIMKFVLYGYKHASFLLSIDNINN